MKSFRKRAWVKSQGLVLRRRRKNYYIYYKHYSDAKYKTGTGVDIKDKNHIKGIFRICYVIQSENKSYEDSMKEMLIYSN